MPREPHYEPGLNPYWVTFWQKVRAAAQELNRIEAEQAEGNPR